MQFLDRFRGKSTKVGKQGIIKALQQQFMPFNIGNKSIVLNNSELIRFRSMQSIKSISKAKPIVLPSIPLLQNRNSPENKNNPSPNINSELQFSKQLGVLIKRRQKPKQIQLKRPLPNTSFIKQINSSHSVKQSRFDVPDDEMKYKIGKDQMRFLKSFERYSSTRNFTIHKIMSKRF